MNLIAHRLTAGVHKRGIRSLAQVGRRVAPHSESVSLPPRSNYPTLAQKLFRGEPAICKFD